MRLGVLVVTAFLLSGCSNAPTEVGPTFELHQVANWIGTDCEVDYLLASVRASDVRPLVPSQYELETTLFGVDLGPELALAVIELESCQVFELGPGVVVEDFGSARLTIAIKDPSPGLPRYYILEWTVTNDTIAEGLRLEGFGVGFGHWRQVSDVTRTLELETKTGVQILHWGGNATSNSRQAFGYEFIAGEGSSARMHRVAYSAGPVGNFLQAPIPVWCEPNGRLWSTVFPTSPYPLTVEPQTAKGANLEWSFTSFSG